MIWFGFLLILVSLSLFILGYHQVEQNRFNEHTPYLFSLGIYSWGQALIISLFWLVVGTLATFILRPIDFIRIYLLFHIFRSAYEILYWNQPKHLKHSSPPLMNHLNHIDTGEHVRLYQLGHLLVVISLLFIMMNLPLM